MSGEGVYRVAIWTGRDDDPRPWGHIFYAEADRWCPLDVTPPCGSEEQVVRLARGAAEVLAKKPLTDEPRRWRSGSPDQNGAFTLGEKDLVAASRIEDLGVSRPR
jgi:hypothetical protein